MSFYNTICIKHRNYLSVTVSVLLKNKVNLLSYLEITPTVLRKITRIISGLVADCRGRHIGFWQHTASTMECSGQVLSTTSVSFCLKRNVLTIINERKLVKWITVIPFWHRGHSKFCRREAHHASLLDTEFYSTRSQNSTLGAVTFVVTPFNRSRSLSVEYFVHRKGTKRQKSHYYVELVKNTISQGG